MRILFLGDIVGRAGRDAVNAALPRLRETLRLDLAIVNVENASHGFGCAPDMAQALFAAGADVLTLGNHAWDRKELLGYIETERRLIRPLNFPPGTPGQGSVLVELADGRRALVLQVMGRLFMEPNDDPFRLTAELLGRYRLGGTVHAIVADLHGEATSEKMAYAHSFDGRVSLVVGTHTHCPYRGPPGSAGRDGIPVRCGDVRRLRQRDRHGQGRGGGAVLAAGAGRAAVAGRRGGHDLPGCSWETADATGLALRIEPVRVGGRLSQAMAS